MLDKQDVVTRMRDIYDIPSENLSALDVLIQTRSRFMSLFYDITQSKMFDAKES